MPGLARRFVIIAMVYVVGAASLRAEDSLVVDDARRPAAIAATGVPVVPPEIIAQLHKYQNVRGAGFAGWRPAGDGVLIRTRFANASQLHRVYEPGGRRQQITFNNEPVRGNFIRKAQDGGIVASSSAGGDENYQLYFLDPRSLQMTLLTDGKSRNGQGPFSPDGKQMVVQSNRRNGRDQDLYIADPRRPDSMRMLFKVDGEYWYASDWSPDGKTLLVTRYISINHSIPAELDVASGGLRRLPLPTDQPSSFADATYSHDGTSIYLTSDSQGEFRQLARFERQTKTYAWLTEDIPWNVTDVEVSRASGDVAFTVNEDGATRLYLIRNGQRRAIDLPLGIVRDLLFSPDGKRLGLTFYRPNAPGDVYDVRLRDDQLTRWTYSELGGLNPQKFVVPQRIEFPSFDQRKIPAYYFKPPGASGDKPAPVIIRIHGGPEGQYRPYFSGSDQYFAGQMGAAVIWPNVRGSAGYGKSYLKLDNGMLREDSVKDIGALLDWIAEQPELDARRVAVSGGSYGGYMVLSSLVHYSDRIRAGIDWVGIANFITFLKNTKAYRRDLRRVEYGDERDPEMLEFFQRINPTANAVRIKSPLLVIHGVNDPRVPFSEAEQIAAKVAAEGVDVWTLYAENEGHGFSKKNNADYARAVEVMFLKKYLQID